MPVAWEAYHRGERYIKCPLPTYAFDREVHWVDDDASMYVASSAEELAAAQAAVDADDAAAAKAAEAEAAAEAAAAAAAAEGPTEPTLVRLREAVTAERKWVTAYCLAYAGGSTAAFAELARAAPEWMEVRPSHALTAPHRTS